jgi:formamidopyrimidine-DNA glycosylase
MPELPEVETLRWGLETTVLGKRIESVSVLWRPTFDVDPDRIQTLVVGNRIVGVRRRGKQQEVDLNSAELPSPSSVNGRTHPRQMSALQRVV